MAAPDPWIAASRTDLLAGATAHVAVDPGDARSGSAFEKVTIDGQPHFAKTLGYRTDWIMRVTGDRDLRTLKIWRAGIMRDAPPEIDHAVVGMAADGEGEDALLTILMRDIGDRPVPGGRLDDLARGPSRAARRPGRALGPVLGLVRRPRPRDARGTHPVLRARQHRAGGRGRRPAVADPGRGAGLAAARRARARARRAARRDPRRARAARRRDAFDARDVPARRLEDGQPRPPRRRPHDPARLGVSRIGPGAVGSRLVSRVEQRAAPDRQGGHDRRRCATRSNGGACARTAGSICNSTCACSA